MCAGLKPSSTVTDLLPELVIRIFGVYTPAEVKNGAWDTVAKQLAKKSKLYRGRYANSACHSIAVTP
jgi:hypothetical protein